MYTPMNKEQLQAVAKEVEAYMASLPDVGGPKMNREIVQIDHLYHVEKETYLVNFHEWNEQHHYFNSHMFVRDTSGKLTTPSMWSYFPSDWQ